MAVASTEVKLKGEVLVFEVFSSNELIMSWLDKEKPANVMSISVSLQQAELIRTQLANMIQVMKGL